MKTLSIAALCAAMAISLSTLGAEPEGTVIELKDGGKIVMQKDGKTYHTDSKGKRVRMKDGVAMEGADGQKYMMKSDAVWKLVSEKGSVPWNR
jgi:hypothetical protein